ncbi:MAG: DUF971 domain-containing protein [Opitutales bacterium]|jgi:DUF971 family protein
MEASLSPADIQIVDRTLAVRWSDGREDYYDSELLRAISPSAENLGEADFFGNVHGGDSRTSYPGVRVRGWNVIGNYALQLVFNDGHSTGFYSYRYLRLIADKEREGFVFPFEKAVRKCGHDHHHHGEHEH